jgi:hypothetical protein
MLHAKQDAFVYNKDNSKMASQQEKIFCVLRFEVSRAVITVQREFRARFKKDAPHKNNYTYRATALVGEVSANVWG